jgi:hypothetical protein
MVPVLKAEKVPIGGSVYAVEGAVMVAEQTRVGRIVGDEVEWVKQQIPPDYPAFGPNGIDSVHGKWPDEIGVIYSNRNGRAPQPRYMPLTGKGLEHVVADGGGLANIMGVARVGEVTLLVASDMASGLRFKPVRGHLVRKPQTPEQAGCKPGEISREPFADQMRAALVPDTAAGTPAGTLVTIGNLCEKRGATAEVWDKDGKAHFVDLTRWWKRVRWFGKLIVGKGDDMWAMGDGWSPLLQLKDGDFEPLPQLDRPVQYAFASQRGELHASDGRTLFRFDSKAWVAVAHLPQPDPGPMIIDEQGTMWTGGVHRLRPDPDAKPPEPVCEAFVYLYEASDKNGPKFTYPGTRKALSSFPEAADLGLVEFGSNYSRTVGVTAKSRAQAEALAAHVRATMKDETPRVFCFDPRKAPEPRFIPLDDKK